MNDESTVAATALEWTQFLTASELLELPMAVIESPLVAKLVMLLNRAGSVDASDGALQVERAEPLPFNL